MAAFNRECARKLARGEAFDDVERDAYLALLRAYDLSGRNLLGRYAGADECIDTVFGRCGLRPPELG